MARTLPIATPNTRLSDVIRELNSSDGPIEIEDEGTTVAVVLSPAEYKAYVRERARQAIDGVRALNRDKSPREIDRDLTTIVEEVRREMYDEQRANSGGC